MTWVGAVCPGCDRPVGLVDLERAVTLGSYLTPQERERVAEAKLRCPACGRSLKGCPSIPIDNPAAVASTA